MKLSKTVWANLPHGEVYLYTLHNGNIEISVTNFGAIITAIRLPSADGARNIVLGYESFEEYRTDPFYLGCVVGRFANRIDGGMLKINDEEYQLSLNEPGNHNHLHGGWSGFNKKLFSVTDTSQTNGEISVAMKYCSPHLEEGYPGNLDVQIRYTLSGDNEFTITYSAKTDRPTHVNLTNHTYFNLSGGQQSAASHNLKIRSTRFLESDNRFLPTGNIFPVERSPYDFTQPEKISSQISLLPTKGFNTYFLLDKQTVNRTDAILSHPPSNISVSLSTTYPGILLYSGDYLKYPFVINGGICLETQYPPNAPAHNHFPSALLEPQNEYLHQTVYRFDW